MRKSKKTLAILAGVLATMLVAGIAFAFWTANGTGSGSASVGTDAGVSITNVAFADSLYPAAVVDVSFDVNNLSTKSPVAIDQVVADDSTYTNGVEIVSAPAATVSNPCESGWFTYSGTTLNTELAKSPDSGSTYSAAAGVDGGTLTMSDESLSNQDGCKGATIKLHLKVDNSGIGGV